MSEKYTFKLERTVNVTEKNAIEYAIKYEGDEIFLKRCINIAREDRLDLALGIDFSILSFLKPKNTRNYKVVICKHVMIDSYSDVQFHEFLEGVKKMSFEEPEEALAFEKLASKRIEQWFQSEWTIYEELKKLI